MTTLLAHLPLAAEKSVSEEGRDIITVMLVVGVIFLGVIVLGQVGNWLAHRRKERPRSRRAQ